MKTNNSNFEQQGTAEIRQAAAALVAYSTNPDLSYSLRDLMTTAAKMLRQAADQPDGPWQVAGQPPTIQ